jgi:penicillin-binding protein 1A
LIGVVALGAYTWTVFQSLKDRVTQISRIEKYLQREPTKIVSADNVVLYRMTNELREWVEYPEIPRIVIDATVAAEDERFWFHGGVDGPAILRALWVNLTSGRIRQGGSTITQQVAKRLLTSGERSLRRKIEDACLAIQIERNLTKEQILTIYLNEVFYGSQAYGIKAAAKVYFGKDLKQLTIGEAALLARLPRRPSTENPFVNPKAAIQNRDVVLKIMRDQGWITEEQYQKAKEEPLKLSESDVVKTNLGIMRAPYFVTYVLDQMREEFPDQDFARGGYTIYTTLNTQAQEAVEQAVRDEVKRNKSRRVTEGAMVVLDLSGRILAMVGGTDFHRSQYNIITQGRRQPGSAFKPFVYAAALELGKIRPTSAISNEPFIWRNPATGKVWKPKGGGGGGMVSVQTALTKSINVPAVHVGMMVGPEIVANFAKQTFGIDSPLYPGPALALGSSAVNPLEMAEAYSVFATGGDRVTAYGITRVEGPGGVVLREFQPRIVRNVLSEETAKVMNDLLHLVVLQGTGHRARSVLNAAGKTGTTSDHKDAWFVGYTTKLIGVSWVANATYDPDRNPPWSYGEMRGVFGGEVAAPMWADAMKKIQKLVGEGPSGYRPKQYGAREDSEQVTVTICVDTGDRAVAGCPHKETRVMTKEEARALSTCGVHGNLTEQPPEAPPATDSPTPPPANGGQHSPSVEGRMVEVEVCVESGQRATTYCPVKRKMKFRSGEEPTAPCSIHKP